LFVIFILIIDGSFGGTTMDGCIVWS